MRFLQFFILFYLINIINIKAQDYLANQLPQKMTNDKYTFKLQWVDDFPDAFTNGRWAYATWTFDNNLCEFRYDNILMTDNALNLQITKKVDPSTTSYPDKPYWSGDVYSKEEYKYGRFICRMKPNSPSGVITSFFLIHIDFDANWNPTEWREIDIEFVGTTEKVQFTLHWIDNGVHNQNPNTINLSIDVENDYHTWIIEWTPEYIKYYLDGELLFTFDDPYLISQVSEGPQRIEFNYWVSSATSWAGEFDESVLPIEASYDYIAYYSLDTTTTSIIETNNLESNKNILLKKANIEYYDILGRRLSTPPKSNGVYFRVYKYQNKILKKEKFLIIN